MAGAPQAGGSQAGAVAAIVAQRAEAKFSVSGRAGVGRPWGLGALGLRATGQG